MGDHVLHPIPPRVGGGVFEAIIGGEIQDARPALDQIRARRHGRLVGQRQEDKLRLGRELRRIQGEAGQIHQASQTWEDPHDRLVRIGVGGEGHDLRPGVLKQQAEKFHPRVPAGAGNGHGTDPLVPLSSPHLVHAPAPPGHGAPNRPATSTTTRVTQGSPGHKKREEPECPSPSGLAKRLPLGELEPGPRPPLTVLLSLLHPGISREQSRLLQWRPQGRVRLPQRPRDPQTDGPGLSARPAPADGGHDVELPLHPDYLERLGQDHLERRSGEEIVHRAAIHVDLSRARLQPDPRHGALAASGPVGARSKLHPCVLSVIQFEAVSGVGRWAAWGWVGPAYTLSFPKRAAPSLFLGSIPRTAFSRTASGLSRSNFSSGVLLRPPGCWEWWWYTFCRSFRPVTVTFSELMMTTKSPTSRWGAKTGFSFPRRSIATRLARRPSVCPWASTSTQ